MEICAIFVKDVALCYYPGRNGSRGSERKFPRRYNCVRDAINYETQYRFTYG